MPRKRACVTCGSGSVTRAGGSDGYEIWACADHRQGLLGNPSDVLDDLTWLQETRPQRMRDLKL